MSNARSPREVCSTTIGTSGLTVLASFRFGRSSPAQLLGWEPGDSLAIAAWPVLPGLAARKPGSRAARRAALGALGVPGVHSLSRACACSIVIGFADSATRSSALRWARSSLSCRAGPLDFRRSSSFFGDTRPGPSPAASSTAVEHLVVGRLDALGVDDRRQHGLAPQRLLGVGLGLVDDLGSRRGRRCAGTPRARCPGGRASGASGPTARARGPRRARPGSRRFASLTAESSAASRNSASIRAVSASAQARADVLAQLVERVEAGLGGEVVVERGQLLGLDLLDRDGELRPRLPGELVRAGSRRGT